MDIRIIKNAHNLRGNVYSGKFILEKEFEPSVYDGINTVRYYMYDVEKNQKQELLADIKKYDILKIKNLDKNSDYLYFTTISEETSDNRKIVLHKYHITTGESLPIYRYEDDIQQYNDYKRIRVFVLNEFYLLIQNEYIRYNLTETFKGYFEFEQFLYCIKDEKLVTIADQNLRTNGIESMKLLKNNICVVKTGFNLLAEERYKKLEKNEVSYERISFVNIGQLVSDILLMNKNIVLDTIDQAYFTETFAYVVVKGSYIVYSKVKPGVHQEEVIFYNYETKDTKLCINQNIFSPDDLAWSYIIGRVPYIRLKSKNGTQFFNLIKNKVDIKFPEDVKVETVVSDLFIVSGRKRGLLGREASTIAVYRYPDQELLHQEKGEYIGCIAAGQSNVYILTK